MKPTDYRFFSAEDYASDDYFIEWCLNPNEKTNDFWNSWIKKHPELEVDINLAIGIVNQMQSSQKTDLNSKMRTDIWRKLESHIGSKTHNSSLSIFRKIASVAAILVIGILMFQYFISDSNVEEVQWVDHINESNHKEIISLSDDTKITLKPLTSIRFPSVFSGDKRELILHGEAFFEVARDESRPFLIYAHETITKVLGTSFMVKAIDGEDVEVEVSSGKVAVYAQTLTNGNINSNTVLFKNNRITIPKPNKKITLTPTQKGVFSFQDRSLEKSISKQVSLIRKLEELPRYKFENESIANVFDVMEQAYGIEIKYDKSALQACSISTELGDVPLRTKLDMICTALNLEMKESNAIIHISGTGCS